jgi:hypothetical protein
MQTNHKVGDLLLQHHPAHKGPNQIGWIAKIIIEEHMFAYHVYYDVQWSNEFSSSRYVGTIIDAMATFLKVYKDGRETKV